LGSSLVYRWQYSATDDPQAVWTTVNSGTANTSTLNTTFTLNNVTVANEGYYRLVVANSATVDHVNCRNVSKSIYLHVSDSLPKPVISSLYGNYKLCGTVNTLTLEIKNPENGISYQWYKDNNILSGETGLSLLVSSPGVYKVQATDALTGCFVSTDTTVTQDITINFPNPVIESESGGTVICGTNAGIMLRLTTDYTNSGTNITYQWFKGSNQITGATSTHYYATDAGDYSILVTVDGCSARSEIISITYGNTGNMPAVDLRSENNSAVLCSGSAIRLYVNNSAEYSAQATYVWYDGNMEITRGVNMSDYYVDTSGIYSVLVFEPNDCLSISTDTITVSVVDSLRMGSISSSMGVYLQYNESTDLTVEGVQGGISPYVYTWYKKSEIDTAWTEIYSGTDSTLTTGSLTKNTCYKVIVRSSDSLLTCNYGEDSICIEVSQVELAIEFMTDTFSICNSSADSVSIKLTNSKQGVATNISIEFKNEGTLPSISTLHIDSLAGDSDTMILVYIPENTDLASQSGSLKAEIISCDQSDANPLTKYGNWKNERAWTGEPQEADEDILNLTVYPNVRLTGKLQDTICSEETFIYEPQSNIEGVVFSWERELVYGIDEAPNTGFGTINEVLTNTDNIPVTVKYVYTLKTDFCPSLITDTLNVVVLPKGKLTLTHTPENGSLITLGTPITITATLEDVFANMYTFIYANDVLDTISNQYEIFLFNEEGINEVNVRVENEYGCILTGTETFTARYNLPNTITPNEPQNNILLAGYDIQVFNRWGSQLYKGKGGWDGKYKDTLVAAGTYLYVVKITQPNGKVLTLKRTVYVKY
jgi:hypothetical protein